LFPIYRKELLTLIGLADGRPLPTRLGPHAPIPKYCDKYIVIFPNLTPISTR
jgi:hypothetical protein